MLDVRTNAENIYLQGIDYTIDTPYQELSKINNKLKIPVELIYIYHAIGGCTYGCHPVKIFISLWKASIIYLLQTDIPIGPMLQYRMIQYIHLQPLPRPVIFSTVLFCSWCQYWGVTFYRAPALPQNTHEIKRVFYKTSILFRVLSWNDLGGNMYIVHYCRGENVRYWITQ